MQLDAEDLQHRPGEDDRVPDQSPDGQRSWQQTRAEEGGTEDQAEADPIQALRGRGKGERLVEKLLQSRREDRQHDESGSAALRS